MKEYLFSTIAAACVIELILEFAPFIKDATIKKYLRYVFALILSLCIIAPFSDIDNLVSTDTEFNISESIGENSRSEYVYFENELFSCECSEAGVPERDTYAVCDMYISECCFGIVKNARLALSSKFSLDLDSVNVGISFNTSDVSDINLICAWVRIDSDGEYLKRDARDYLEKTLGCKVYEMGV